jgi:hypothetical protein
MTSMFLVFIFAFFSDATPANRGAQTFRYQRVAQVALPVPRTTTLEVKSFKEWKSEKTERVSERLNVLKEQLKTTRQQAKEDLARSLLKDVAQEEWNLEVAKDLSVAQYFELYLSRHPSEKRFQEAASKMSVIEVAELMEAYAKAIGVDRAEPPASQGISKTALSRETR